MKKQTPKGQTDNVPGLGCVDLWMEHTGYSAFPKKSLKGKKECQILFKNSFNSFYLSPGLIVVYDMKYGPVSVVNLKQCFDYFTTQFVHLKHRVHCGRRG